MTLALVALGGNIGPRRRHLDAARDALDQLPETQLLRSSRWIETDPVDTPPGSPKFLNGACLLETALTPHDLLRELQRIEAELGRVRDVPNGPRVIDLDLVLHGSAVLRTPELELPHPRAHERDFVLDPACEIAPLLEHPVLGESLAALCERRRGSVA